MRRGKRHSARARREEKRRRVRAARETRPNEIPAAKPQKALSTRKSLGFVYIAHLFRYVYGVILIPYYGRVLGADEYGKVLAASALFQIVWLFIEYGCPVAGVRDIAETQDNKHIPAQVGRQLMARMAMLPIGIAIGIGGTLISPVLRAEPDFGLYAVAVGISSAFHMGWYFQGSLQFRTQMVLEVLGFAMSLGLILGMVQGPEDGERVLQALLISSVAANLLAYTLVARQIDIRHIRLGGAFGLLRKSTALFASRGLRVMMATASTYLLSLFATAAQVGYYGPAERFSSVGLGFMQPISQVLMGTVTRRLNSDGAERAAYRLMRNGILLMLGFGSLALMGTTALSGWIMPLILGPGFERSIIIMQIFAFIFPFAAFNQAVSTYVLVPLHKDNYVIKGTAVCAVVSMASVFVCAVLGEVEGTTIAGARVVGEVVGACFLLMVLVKQGIGRKIFLENGDEISGGYSDRGSPRATDANSISTR